MKPLDIVYLHSHDTGRYVQPYGYAVPTPSIQELAEQGLLFRSAFCAAPTCSPSRAALLTGEWAHCSGMLGLAHRGFSLADPRRHLARVLADAGYHTVLAGVQHVGTDDAELGYLQMLDTDSNRASEVAPAAAEFLGNPLPRGPFFLDVGFFETHLAFPEPRDDGRHCRPPAPLPDAPEVRADMAGFRESARLLDDGVGIVLDALERSSRGRETLVVCTTDHGLPLPGMKCNLTDHGIGVMLVMRGPGGFEGGRAIDGMVSQIDLFPTLCELLEIEAPGWLQGRSMMPLMRGEAEEINDAVFAEVTFHAAYEPQRAVRTRRWKYIRRFEDREGPVLPNCDDSRSKQYLLERGWRERAPEPEQLYDLAFDPNEARNLAADPGRAGVLGMMRRRLDRWMKETGDPLLSGPVRAPAGARINDVDGLSPREKPRPIE